MVSIHSDSSANWFQDARFGLFLHWGLYSLEGVHEQDQWRYKIPREVYAERMQRFRAEAFNAEAWLDYAESIGAGYLVLTTKHHDGFCLWDSKVCDFNSMQSPAKCDIVAELAEACHRRNFPLGLYYSVVDWKHPNYPNEDRHHELPPQTGDSPDWDSYTDYLLRQCEELCTLYGKIHLWWWDMNVPEVEDPRVNEAIRKWQPGILINNRGMDAGDFKTPEREVLDDGTEARVYHQLTEACESVSPQAWCHRPDDALYHSSYLIRNLSRHMAKGGNYLLNLGPDAQGALPKRDAACVAEVGQWFQRMREALTADPVTESFEPAPQLYTRRDNTLYVILTEPPSAEALELAPLTQQPLRVKLLNDGRSLESRVEPLPMRFYKNPPEALRVHGLPDHLPQGEPLVVQLDFDQLEIAETTAVGTKTIL